MNHLLAIFSMNEFIFLCINGSKNYCLFTIINSKWKAPNFNSCNQQTSACFLIKKSLIILNNRCSSTIEILVETQVHHLVNNYVTDLTKCISVASFSNLFIFIPQEVTNDKFTLFFPFVSIVTVSLSFFLYRLFFVGVSIFKYGNNTRNPPYHRPVRPLHSIIFKLYDQHVSVFQWPTRSICSPVWCLTSYPVMAMRCMESLTALRMPKMEVSASCRSSAPSQVLLYLSISCSHKHTAQCNDWRTGSPAKRSFLCLVNLWAADCIVPSAAADIWWSSEQASASMNLSPVYAPAFSDTPGGNTKEKKIQ